MINLGEDKGQKDLPEKGDLVDFGNHDSDQRKNIVSIKNGQPIWLIYQFEILGKCGTATPNRSTPDVTPNRSTPNATPSRASTSTPRSQEQRPIETPEKANNPNSNDDTVTPQKEALFTPSPKAPQKRTHEESFSTSTPSTSNGTAGSNKTRLSGFSAAAIANRTPPSAKRSLLSLLGQDDLQKQQLKAENPTHKIDTLTPYTNKFKIRAKATRAEIKECSSSRWQGNIFNVILNDDSGDIKCTAFNNEAKKFSEIIKNDKIYAVSNAKVQPIKNPRWNDTGHEYELLLTNTTLVVPALIRNFPGGDPNGSFNFVKFKNLKPIKEVNDSILETKVDVIGYCLNVDEPKAIVTRDQREVKKREITLIDQGESPIRLTLWGENSEKFDESNTGKIIGVKNAIVKEFRGNVNLSGGEIITDLPERIPEVIRLKNWVDTNPMALSLADSNNSTNGSHNASRNEADINGSFIDANNAFYTLAEMKRNYYYNSSSIPTQYFTVDAYVHELSVDNFCYPACPGERCMKKLQETKSGTAFKYMCPKCHFKTDQPQHRFILKAVLADCTDYQHVTLFDETASKLLGKSASEMLNLRDENPYEFYGIFKDADFKRLELRLELKTEVYNDERRLKPTVTALKPMDTTTPQFLERMRRNLEKLTS